VGAMVCKHRRHGGFTAADAAGERKDRATHPKAA
jgi:hypothetical protein